MNNDSIVLQISRNSEIRDSRGIAVLSLDLVDHFPGQLIMTSYYTSPEKIEVDTIFAVGIKSGKGRDCYRILATGKQNVLWDVVYEIPDVSALVNGEIYAYRDPDDNWFYVYLVGDEKTLEPIGTKPILYRCLRDNMVWIACEDRKLRPLSDFIGRAEVTNYLKALKDYVDEKLQGILDDVAQALENSEEAKELATDADTIARALQHDLLNYYYTKSQTYSKEEVNELIMTIQKFTYEVVPELPQASEETLNKLFLVPMTPPTNTPSEDEDEDGDNNSRDDDNYEEYVTIRTLTPEGLFEYSWELIGNTRVDLSGYAKLEDLAFLRSGESGAVLRDSDNLVSGNHAVAIGNKTKASGESSLAEGYNTETGGVWTENTKTDIGQSTSSGSYAHSEGNATIAVGPGSHSEGKKTISLGNSSHAEGEETKASGAGSHSEGYQTVSSGGYSHAEGYQSVASGLGARASGIGTTASGSATNAEGNETEASSFASHAEGSHTKANSTNGCSHAEGYNTEASGDCSHAEGSTTKATEVQAHAEGYLSTAEGSRSHAEGEDTHALGSSSHSEGKKTTAKASRSHAEGEETYAGGSDSHAEGFSTKTTNKGEHAEGRYNKSTYQSTIHSIGIGTSDSNRKNAVEVMVSGDVYIKGIGTYDGTNPTPGTNDLKTIIDSKTSNTGTVTSVSAGTGLNITGDATTTPTVEIGSGYKLPTTTEWGQKADLSSPSFSGTPTAPTATAGTDNTQIATTAFVNTAVSSGISSNQVFISGSGTGSAVLKNASNTASGNYAVAEGYENSAGGDRSHVEGYSNEAAGAQSHAEGNNTKASGQSSHAEGVNAETGGNASSNTKTAGTAQTSGAYAHAEGNATIAQGIGSHSEGKLTFASGAQSHAEGNFTIAQNPSEHAEGQFNKSNKASTTFGDSGNTIHSIGIGTADNSRKNAIEVMQSGDLYVFGIGGYTGDNPSTASPLRTSIPELYKYQVTESGKIIKGFGVTYDGTQRTTDFRYPIPENVSDLTNDLGFTTVQEVVGYLDTLNKYNINVVTALPQASAQTMGAVYMVFVDSGVLGIGKIAEKYITVENSGVYSWKEYDSSPYADLTNYYTKSEVYTKTEVDQIVQEIKQFTYVVADSLPTASSETMYKIYLVPKSSGSSQGNTKDEYITIQSGSTYSWELIGSTDIDLSGYLQTSGGTMTGDLVMSGNAPTINFTRNNVTYSITLGENGLEISQGSTTILQLGGNNLIWRGVQVATVNDLGKFPTSAPSNPVTGSTYFDNDMIYVYNGTSWVNSSGNINWVE